VLVRAYRRLGFSRRSLAAANHRVLARAPLVAKPVAEPRFALHDLGAFPGMVAGGEHAIAGEVYAVDGDSLAELDRLESVPRFYQRAPIPLADGTTAETYLLTHAQVEGRPVIGSCKVSCVR